MTNPVPDKGKSVPVSHVAAVVAGNALEFYDFLTYAFFAVYIGRAFFPSNDPSSSLMASLATFGAGFLTRPVGGVVIGRMGDRLGRKPAMIFSFSLMGLAITGLALTPSYSTIGVAAPILAVIFRVVQGFALGGDVGPTTAFLLEAAPPERRGFYGAFQAWTQHLSVLFAGLVGFGLARAFNEQQLQNFGWRIAFLIGTAIVPFGLIMRRRLPETFHSQSREHSEAVRVRRYWGVIVVGLMLLASGTIGTYVSAYLTTYALATLHMAANVAFAPTVVVGLCGVVFDLPSGLLSDRVGRKPMMLIPGILLLASILPAFYAILHFPTTAMLVVSTAVVSTLMSISLTPMIVWLGESFPASIRSGGLAIVYAIAIAVFGGSTQYVVTWLIRATRNPLAPAWYWTVATVIGIVAIIAARETAPRKAAELEAMHARLSTGAES